MPKYPPFVPHFSGEVPTSMGVVGTLGTSDTAGSANSLPVSVDADTGAQWVKVINGTVTSQANLTMDTGTITTIVAGTQNTLGTVGTIPGIGTITNLGSISTIGTMPAISVTANPESGTLNTLGTIGTVIGAGTLSNIGSLTNIGTIKEITNIVGGTVTTSLALNTGTLTTVAAGTLNTLGTVGTVPGVGTVSNLGSVTNIGTVKEVSNIAGGTLDTTSKAIVSAENSTTTTLDANGTWTGGTTDLLNYNTIRTSVFSDQDSAADGLKIRFSNDGTNWDIIRQTTLIGSQGVYAAFNRVARYFSPQYINGAGSQTAFRYQTVLTPNSPEFTRRFLSEIPKPSNAGIITQSVIVGSSTAAGGTFVAVKVNPSGAVQVGGVVDISTGTVTSVSELVKGTVTSVGTLVGAGVVTTVSNLTSGSVRMTVGTLTTGSLSNLAMLNAGTVVIPTGTVTTIVAGTQNTLGTVGVVNSIAAGTQNTLGTVAVVNSVAAGTQNTLGTVGVINNIVTGTLASVKINNTPVGSAVLPTHVLGTGGTIWGTLVAPTGAGTNLYVTGVYIVGHAGTCDYAITNNVAGSTGAGVLARGFFAPGGGINSPIEPAINLGANGTVAYLVNGNGTASFGVRYWVAP